MSAQPENPEQIWRKAWEEKDPRRFLDAIQRVDWSRASAEDFQGAIRAALDLGSEGAATRLANEGVRVHSQDEALAGYAHVLAPPRVVGARPATGTTLFWAAHEWVREHAEEYRGKWVLLKGTELIAAADDLADLRPFKQRDDISDLYLTQIST